MIKRSLDLFRSFSSDTARQMIETVIKENDVVLFMKGTAAKPMCGYSRAVCQILNMNTVDKYTTVDVLEDEQVRSEIKAFSSWPTIPQVYIKGNFIGGCDIIMEMHKSGKLEELLRKEGIIKA